MVLFFRKLGSGEPVIILHGLYGSADNWYSIGRQLANSYLVYLVDQRNHGNSPHHPEHNYDLLSRDLDEFMQLHQISKAVIMGHSMGGKTALAFGMKYPEKVKKMIIIDISPMAYSMESGADEANSHRKIIHSLLQLDVDHLINRGDADRQLRESIPSPAIRQFLLKNLKRTRDGKFKMALNVKVLAENMPAIFDGIIHENISDPRTIPQFPLLFIKGERSGYIGPGDEEAIRHYFPWSGLKVISGSGHWVHAEQPEALLKVVDHFIRA
jgi:pimeloyl-ACP methyl ester carboxylesterase